MNDTYSENVKRWGLFEPQAEALLKNVQADLETSPRTEEDTRSWFEQQDLHDRTIFYIYGVGVGELFPLIDEWLEKNPLSHAIFLEPDPSKIKSLLEREVGTKILNHPRMMLRHANDKTLFHMATLFVLKPYVFGVWDNSDPARMEMAKARVDFLTSQRLGIITEYGSHGRVFLANYFANLSDLPHAYLAEKLFGKFQGVPAIICGAGPSLAKNVEMLKSLGDRALIFAGGTAMNALNAFGFNPHFGVGIDPNYEQFTRLIMNQAFEVPYFYKPRFLNKALETVHGDHVAITGSSGYDIGKWIDEKLGLETPNVEEGHNVINLSTALATLLGCNPIIFVGLDLAYTDMQSYSSGVVNHPLHNLRDQFHTKTHQEELVRKDDIYGKATLTLWKWIAESVWYSNFAYKHKDILFVNATEGGIGFEGIPNVPLAQVAATLLINHYDLKGRVEQAIQMAQMPQKVDEKAIQGILNDLYNNLQVSIKFCSRVIDSFDEVEKQIKADEEPPIGLLNEKGMEALLELEQQPAYDALLKMYNTVFRDIFLYQFEKIDRDALSKPEKEINLEKVALYRNRIKYVREGGKAVLRILEDERSKALQTSAKLEIPPQNPPKDTQIPDNLEDYSVFYGEQGNVISLTSYAKNGLKEGVAKTFYNSGILHSLIFYQNGVLQGRQEYYYPTGILKSVLNYHQGLLSGDILLYYPTGSLKRELHFAEGKRHGIERLWNYNGTLIVEAEFNQNKACGIARRWYDNGILAQEVIFKEDESLPEYAEWTESGEKKIRTTPYKYDYFDQVALQTGSLTHAMEQMLNQVNAVVPAVETTEKKEDLELRKDIEAVKAELKKMHKAGQQLMFETGLDPSNPDEAIWKSPETRKDVEGQIEKLTEMMSGELSSIQNSLLKTVELLTKKLENIEKKPPETPPEK